MTYTLMGESESYSSNTGASQGDEPIESANPKKRKETKGKEIANQEPARKHQRLEPLHFVVSANVNEILDIDESLGDIRIPSPIPVQPEDDEPPSPTNTEIVDSDNEVDILDNEFEEGMISALRGIQEIPVVQDIQEEQDTEQPTIPDWLKERLKMKESKKVPEEEDDMVDFLTKLEAASAKKPTKTFSTIQRDEAGHRTIQVAILTVDKSREEITPQEYAITSAVDLSPTTKG